MLIAVGRGAARMSWDALFDGLDFSPWGHERRTDGPIDGALNCRLSDGGPGLRGVMKSFDLCLFTQSSTV